MRSLLAWYLVCSAMRLAACSFSERCISAADSIEVVITPMKRDLVRGRVGARVGVRNRVRVRVLGIGSGSGLGC